MENDIYMRFEACGVKKTEGSVTWLGRKMCQEVSNSTWICQNIVFGFFYSDRDPIKCLVDES